jgi:hypothetical protein
LSFSVSALAFLRLGGQLAWYLIALAALVALLRRSVGQPWRVIHMLNYIAFLLATVRANLIGIHLQYTPREPSRRSWLW